MYSVTLPHDDITPAIAGVFFAYRDFMTHGDNTAERLLFADKAGLPSKKLPFCLGLRVPTQTIQQRSATPYARKDFGDISRIYRAFLRYLRKKNAPCVGALELSHCNLAQIIRGKNFLCKFFV